MLPRLNMPGLRIWSGWDHTRLTQGSEYALIMPQYAVMFLISAEYA